jgi:hypothetical protein
MNMRMNNETTNQKENKMNATNNGLKTCKQLCEMLDNATSDMARTVLEHAIGATRDYENTRTTLTTALEYCHGQLEQAERELKKEGRAPNSLGVLQGNGVEVDRLCGELAHTRQAAEAAKELLTTLGIQTLAD